MPNKQRWKNEPDDHDYPAATDYLSLVLPEKVAARAVKRLRSAPVIHRKANPRYGRSMRCEHEERPA
jgi:hypothetical protein